jgi:hypothetical protein
MSKMDVRILFVQRKESYEGEHAPEALLVDDEFTEEINPDYFEKEKEKILNEAKDDITGYCVVRFEVDQDRIRELCFNRETIINAKEMGWEK